MKLREVVEKLQLEIAAGAENLDCEVTGGCVSDILSDVMAKAPKGSIWVTNHTHQNVIALVFFKRLSGVIIAGGLELEEDALQKAIEKQIPVFKTKLSAFDVVGYLYELGLRGQ
jgi:predicted transcriptional regulator